MGVLRQGLIEFHAADLRRWAIERDVMDIGKSGARDGPYTGHDEDLQVSRDEYVIMRQSAVWRDWRAGHANEI